MAPPMHLKGIPRRSRILAVALFCGCLLFLLPRVDLGFTAPRLLSFGASKPKYDMLKFVDPLIGTTNGGECLIPLPAASPSSLINKQTTLSHSSQPKKQAMSSPAHPSPTVSPPFPTTFP